MKNKKKFNRKNLKKRLAVIMMVYMDGLNEAKRQKLEGYIEPKLDAIVRYYVRLLKKKKIKKMVLPEFGQLSKKLALNNSKNSVMENTA